MTKFILFAAILFSSLGVTFAQIQATPSSDDQPQKCLKRTALDNLMISKESKVAVYALMNAERFEIGYVGFAANPSAYIKNFKTILGEQAAAELFEYLFDEATPAGKLYALSGLYLTDKEAYVKAAGLMKKSGVIVRVLNGCLMSDEAAAKIVETDVENVAIIEPGKTIKEFWATNAGSFELDIAHGGYPATFREFADSRAREK